MSNALRFAFNGLSTSAPQTVAEKIGAFKAENKVPLIFVKGK